MMFNSRRAPMEPIAAHQLQNTKHTKNEIIQENIAVSFSFQLTVDTLLFWIFSYLGTISHLQRSTYNIYIKLNSKSWNTNLHAVFLCFVCCCYCFFCNFFYFIRFLFVKIFVVSWRCSTLLNVSYIRRNKRMNKNLII